MAPDHNSAGRLVLNAKPCQAPASATTSPSLPQQTLVICDPTTLQVTCLSPPCAVTSDEIEREGEFPAQAVLSDPRNGDGDAYIVVVLQADSIRSFHKILYYQSKTGIDAESHVWSEKTLAPSSQQPPRDTPRRRGSISLPSRRDINNIKMCM
ncbi:hypothetical protein E2562_003728 [Oryza meyeriana var. granulata]|uniref:Uncharacterized protein n=1 Tax=Oryza meyeriana var. granulata TaxID=110450 RepID=A0A6G1C4U9_9ORYZ|nr:hypothetical protein E2562_003728 [Oryza meyeriana var. granulata]